MLNGKRLRVMALVLSAAALIVVGARAQDRPGAEAKVPRDINEAFQDPDLDAKKFVDRFESESREVYEHREKIAAALKLEPGMEVADVGAGTGSSRSSSPRRSSRTGRSTPSTSHRPSSS